MGPIRRASRVGFHMWDAGLTAHLLLPQQPRLLLDRQPTRTQTVPWGRPGDAALRAWTLVLQAPGWPGLVR